jgi:hypothetical protein
MKSELIDPDPDDKYCV